MNERFIVSLVVGAFNVIPNYSLYKYYSEKQNLEKLKEHIRAKFN